MAPTPFSILVTRTWNNHVLLLCIATAVVLLATPVGAAESSIPWQCTSYTYTESSQEECLQVYSGEQGQKIAELERQLKRQEVLLNELRDQISRQAQQQVQVRNIPSYPPPNNFGGPPLLGRGQFGFGSLLGLGLSILPPVAIVID